MSPPSLTSTAGGENACSSTWSASACRLAGGRVDVRHGGLLRGRARGRAALDRESPLRRRRGAIVAAPVEPRLRHQRREQRLRTADRLRAAQQQHAARAQAVVEQRHQAPLQRGVEVDQQVAAGQDVEPGERRVEDHVVLREQHHVADALVDLVAAVAAAKKRASRSRRQVGGDRRRRSGPLRAAAIASALRSVAKICSVAAGALGQRVEHFPEHHGQRIGLLAGRAADHPGAQRPASSALPRQQLGQHRVLQVLPDRRVAEERWSRRSASP